MINELMRRRAMMMDNLKTVYPTYTAGSSFKLMGVTFNYDATLNRYTSGTTNIFPTELIIILSDNYPINPSYYINLLGGYQANAPSNNESWSLRSSPQTLYVRFDGQRSQFTSTGTMKIIKIAGQHVYINDVDKGTHAGTMKLNSFNSRDGGVAQGNNIICIKVK